MIRKLLKTVAAIVAAAWVTGGVMAAVPMQTTKDSAVAGRLIINGNKVFISGMNIAWISGSSFSNDVGDAAINIGGFTAHIKNIKNSGGNAVRWWLHTDAKNDPKFSANNDGSVTGLGSKTISNIGQALDTAYKYGVVVSLCLFSFDMLHDNGNTTDAIRTRNEKFLTVPSNLDTYITNALRPILDAVGSHPAIMCWEVFNEPEGMASETNGWATKKIAHSHILRFTNKIAGEVHRRTKKMASTGIHNFSQNERSRYSTATLKAAGGDNDGYLDFYMAHYYPEWGGTGESPFHHPASFWGFDKPVLIGEFPAQNWGPGTSYDAGIKARCIRNNEGNCDNKSSQPGTAMTITAAYEYAYNNGYCGAMSWSMTESDVATFGNFATTQPALENLSNKHKADIDLGGTTVVTPTGDQVMKVVLNGLPTGSPQAELGKEETQNLSEKTNLTFEMYIASGSGTNIKIMPVVKVGSEYVWSPATKYAVDLSTKTVGQWFTVTIPIANGFVPDKGSFSASDIKGIVLQFQPSATYTGTIFIDNIKADNTVLYNFNDMGSEWSMTKWNEDTKTGVPVPEATVSQVPRSSVGSTTPVIHAVNKNVAARTPTISVHGNILNVAGIDNVEASVKLVNLRGKTVADFRAIGNASFGLANVPAGNYLVELTAGGKKIGSSRVVVR